ncbi:hypothetical protein TNCV_2871711 [Trichonephila clavipes]|nr:hypothetical protein TNCV_2871711 [Trichonephila clavipes]
MDRVIFNHGHVTSMTPEMAPLILTTTPHQREDVRDLDRFNVHRCPKRRILMVHQADNGTLVKLQESEDISSKDWPGCYPALNILKHIRDALGRPLSTRSYPQKNIKGLW